MKLDQDCIKAKSKPMAFTHDVFFHTILGLADVETELHNPELDLTAGCHG